MDNKKQHHGGGNFNVFIFGVLVGVAATLLLTTKRGRKLLKVITDEGLERFGKFEDIVKTMEKEAEEEATFTDDGSVVGEDVEDVAGNDYVEPEVKEEIEKMEKIEVKPHHAPKVEHKAHVASAPSDEPPAPPKKRLFRGIRKK